MRHDFGHWLRQQRRVAGLTQGELARRASITKSYISALETGLTQPTTGKPVRPRLEKVDVLAGALGTPVGEARLAAGYAPPDTPVDKLETRVINYMRELPEEARQNAVAMIEGLYRMYKTKG